MVGEWVFPSVITPDLSAIADGLRRSMLIDVIVEGEHEDAVLFVPKLGERLFDWRITSEQISVQSFVPAHPYLWEQLDAILVEAGGRPGGNAIAWRPEPARASLRRPWKLLTLRERLILRTPAFAAARPFDRLLP